VTHPRQSAGQPPFEDAAAATIAAARGQQRRPVLPAQPLTEEDKAEAAKVAQAKLYCTLCGGAHAMPSTPACPRLSSFELDGDGKLKAGTFWPGLKWAKGRVALIEDLHEKDGND
jgi:hypothetical protein